MPNQNFTLPTIYVGKQPLPGLDPIGGGFSKLPSHGMSTHQMIDNVQGQIHNYIDSLKSSISNSYAVQSQQLPQSVENDLAAVRSEVPAGPLSSTAGILHEIGITSTLIHRKTLELNSQTVIANSFYGNDPLNKTSKEFADRASQIDKNIFNIGPTIQSWANAYHAAYSARLLSQAIQLLNQQQASLQNQLAAAQLEEQRRLAAQQELQRIAAEFARLKSEAEALVRAQEEAQLAELKANLAEAERQAEQARLDMAETLAAGQHPIVASAGATAAFGLAFSGTSGTVNVGPATSMALRSALRAAISTAIGAIATAAAPILVGFAALLAPSRLGNSELYSVSVPLADVAPDLTPDLYELAATGREIDLPVRIISKTVGNRVEIFVTTTDGVTVPTNVPVKLARFNVLKNVYVSASSAPSGPVVTWTPLAEPLNPSSDFPVTDTGVPIYEGASATPVEGRIDTTPILDSYDFGGFITVFPAESGIPPLYVVFNTPYDGATTTGEHSGRNYNQEEAGGPIANLDFRKAEITRAGIDAVKLHTSRLDQSDANDVMIQRLEKILTGALTLTDTDTDLRYYTHEIRELDRFRALNLGDDFKPDSGSPIWNNAHTATLEDYQLSSDDTLLYSEDAIEAGNGQINRIYEQMLKGTYE